MKLLSHLFWLMVLLTACQPIDPARFPVQLPTQAENQPTVGVTLQPEGFIQRIHDPVMAKEEDVWRIAGVLRHETKGEKGI